jgi:hypothetical protein
VLMQSVWDLLLESINKNVLPLFAFEPFVGGAVTGREICEKAS